MSEHFRLDLIRMEWELSRIWEGRDQEAIYFGKRIDAIQSKIDKHYKENYASKKEKIRYKNRRMRWKRDGKDFASNKQFEERYALETGKRDYSTIQACIDF